MAGTAKHTRLSFVTGVVRPSQAHFLLPCAVVRLLLSKFSSIPSSVALATAIDIDSVASRGVSSKHMAFLFAIARRRKGKYRLTQFFARSPTGAYMRRTAAFLKKMQPEARHA